MVDVVHDTVRRLGAPTKWNLAVYIDGVALKRTKPNTKLDLNGVTRKTLSISNLIGAELS